MKQNCINNYRFWLSLVAILLVRFSLFPQNSSDGIIISTIDSTKKIDGCSDLLVNGPLYFQANRQANGSPYLFNEEFEDGVVYTGETEFKNSSLNYDISVQELLLLITTSNDSRVVISLSDALIDSFMFSKYLFVNPVKIGLTSDFTYLHKINNGKFTMYIGYQKDFINRFNNTNPYGKYGSSKRSIVITDNQKINNISSKKTLLRLFPSISKDLLIFLRKNKIKLRKASSDQLAYLMEFINDRYEN